MINRCQQLGFGWLISTLGPFISFQDEDQSLKAMFTASRFQFQYQDWPEMMINLVCRMYGSEQNYLSYKLFLCRSS